VLVVVVAAAAAEAAAAAAWRYQLSNFCDHHHSQLLPVTQVQKISPALRFRRLSAANESSL
jgi:hypothetical protein